MIASIDIGTNSVRLLIGDWDNGTLKSLHTQLITTRLGEGVNQNQVLSQAAMERTYQALIEFSQVLKAWKVKNVIVTATSAVRDGANRAEFIQQVKEKTGWNISVLSGGEEASASFVGAISGLKPKQDLTDKIMVLDIGGGSTELILGSISGIIFNCNSLQLGGVRLTELAGDNIQEMQAIAKDNLMKVLNNINAVTNFDLIGVGGTITTLASLDLALASYEPHLVTGHSLTKCRVHQWISRLLPMTLEERSMLPGMAPGREDIIVAGLVIVVTTMELLTQERLFVSDSDLLQGVIYQTRKNF